MFQGLQAEISQILVPERGEAVGRFRETSSNHFKSETNDLNDVDLMQRRGLDSRKVAEITQTSL